MTATPTQKQRQWSETRSRTTDWHLSVGRWFDSTASGRPASENGDRIDWLRCIPFVAMHLACLGALAVGFSWIALGVAVGLYWARMFFVTAFYHRYFAHNAFQTSRLFQGVMATAGSLAVQRDPLWWAAHHRHHHAHADQPEDPHSPRLRGFLWSHTGWFMTRRNFPIRSDYVRDLLRFPELRFLARFEWLPPLLLATGLYGLGSLLENFWPDLGTHGPQMLVWGFFISTVVLYHVTYTINSLAHVVGTRRFLTQDDSRNNWFLALLTLGEGWHNNHHHYPSSARQGFYWWEIDVTYYLLLGLSRLGLIWDLKPVPEQVLGRRLAAAEASPST